MTTPQVPFRRSTFVLALLLFIFIFLLALTKITNYDIWFHLATGRHILGAGIAETDPFTYTQPGAPMYLQNWLAGLMFYLIWRVGGIEGLTLAKGLFSVILFSLLWLASWNRGAHHRAFGLVTAAILVVGAFGLKFRLFLRPHLLEFLLLAGALLLLHRYRWRILPLVPALAALQLLWVNIHGSFPLGLALPVLFLVGDTLDCLTGRPIDLRRAAKVAVLTVAALLTVTVLNPAGLEGLTDPFILMGRGESLSTIGEFQPLKLVHLTGFGIGYTWGYSALALLGLAGLAGSLLRGRRPPAWEPILFSVFLVLPPIVGVRFIAEFVVVACPLVIGWWLALLPSRTEESKAWPAAEIVLGVLLLPLWWFSIAQNPIYRVGLGVKPDKFPAQAVEFLEKTRPPGLIFNSIGFGGYLIWHLPSYKVFIDGRTTVYSDDFYRLYRRAAIEPTAWAQIEETFVPTVVILQYLTDLARREQMPHLENNPAWALVFWDPVAKIYLKRIPANAKLIGRYEYRWARPAYFKLNHLVGVLSNRENTRRALHEFRGAISDNDRNAEAYLGLAFLDSFGPEPDWNEGLEAARRALQLKPWLAKAHATACRAHLGRGERELAQVACSRALSLDPRDVVARWANRTLQGLPPGRPGHP
jgi:hypothetical protein